MTKEIWQNIVKSLCRMDKSFDALDEIELALNYEKFSDELIPEQWLILY